jgi:hypothetical protein
LRNIHYTEYDESQSIPDSKNTFPAEYVLVEKKYKPAFIKNATEKIEARTRKRVEEIFTEIRKVLLPFIKP